MPATQRMPDPRGTQVKEGAKGSVTTDGARGSTSVAAAQKMPQPQYAQAREGRNASATSIVPTSIVPNGARRRTPVTTREKLAGTQARERATLSVRVSGLGRVPVVARLGESRRGENWYEDAPEEAWGRDAVGTHLQGLPQWPETRHRRQAGRRKPGRLAVLCETMAGRGTPGRVVQQGSLKLQRRIRVRKTVQKGCGPQQRGGPETPRQIAPGAERHHRHAAVGTSGGPAAVPRCRAARGSP